ncbi:pyridoxamine 5'-phosphate oxidase-like protein [Kribbella amoyensis]|uniref:Pyridoxamine 5'-phosphate oxidase-like protein n=1 Tax=Kribbella amoyensis TaxID=996641 RepID=A0A561AZH0_9ACTN|nr:pyridoxamine 5'-phosphate oxidase family protein [Kribbella amoyensis]TWD72009.1 pyridoxamine 5'-phosphate oxidase-like protein [Kribbella amoyensis]
MDTVRTFDPAGLEILDPPECLRLLMTVPVGRLVFSKGGLPAVRVVNFLLDGDTIVIATGPGDKYRAAVRGDVVGFEVDELDADRHLGWTVTVIGHLSVVPADEAAVLDRSLPLRSWAPQLDHHLIRLGAESVTGRRLVPWGQRPR